MFGIFFGREKKKSLLEFVQSHQTFCFALNEMYLNISPYVCVCVLRLMKTSFNAYSPTLWKKQKKYNRNITNVYVLFGCFFSFFLLFRLFIENFAKGKVATVQREKLKYSFNLYTHLDFQDSKNSKWMLIIWSIFLWIMNFNELVIFSILWE